MAKPQRYHISKRTHEPVICKAQYSCPFGDLATEHYATREEAYRAIEEKLKDMTFAAPRLPGEALVTPLPPRQRISPDSVVVPRGLYLMADPKNTLEDQELWTTWKRAAGMGKDVDERHAFGASVNGKFVMALSTMGGAGSYKDTQGRELVCESGYLGLTSVALLKQRGWTQEDFDDVGVLVNVGKSTPASYEYGLLSFGDNLQVFTDVEEAPLDEDPYDISDVEADLEDPADPYGDAHRASFEEELQQRRDHIARLEEEARANDPDFDARMERIRNGDFFNW